MQKSVSLKMVPMLLVMGTIFYLSHQSFSDSPPLFPGFDKLAHFTIYGVLGMTILFAQSEKTRNNALNSGFWVMLVATLYGISDEIHQSFVPGRQPDVFDVLADSFGAFTVSLLWYLKQRFSRS